METTLIRFRKSRDIGEILSDSFAFIRLNFGKLIKCLAFITGPIILLASAGYTVLIYVYGSRGTAGLTAAFGALAFTGVAFMIFLGIANVLLSTVVCDFIILYMDRGPDGFDVSDVWASVRQDFIKVFVTTLGHWFVMMILLMVAIVPIIGVLITFFGGIYVSIPLLFLPIIRLREGIGFSDALSRSFDLIKGHWWQTVGILLVSGVIMFVLYLVLIVPQLLIRFLVDTHSTSAEAVTHSGLGLYSLVSIIMGTLVWLALYLLGSIPAVSIALQYFNLVEQKEGAGLMERIEEFGTPLQDHTIE